MTEEILILVKTYPTFSRRDFEIVCTAGINREGEWRRIYPIPFRDLEEIEQYKKYQWIEVDIQRNFSDPRPESYKLRQGSEIKIISNEPLSTDACWQERKDALKQTPVYTNLHEIIDGANEKNELSLCQFKPKEILELKIGETEREWNVEIIQQIEAINAQKILFEYMEREIKLVDKLPYKFSYTFLDDTDRESTLMIEDWEIGQLYWNCLNRANGDEPDACQKVKEKYEGFIQKNDITLFLGTTRQFHGRAKNPFVITGVFYPKKNPSDSHRPPSLF